MRLDFSLLAPDGGTVMGPSIHSGLIRDRASEHTGHAYAIQNKSLIATVTAVTAETGMIFEQTTEAPGGFLAVGDQGKSSGLQSVGHSGPSGHSLYLCGDSSLLPGLTAGHAGHSLPPQAALEESHPSRRKSIVRTWISENCSRGDRVWGGFDALHRNFNTWCQGRGIATLSPHQFSATLIAGGLHLDEELGFVGGLILRRDATIMRRQS